MEEDLPYTVAAQEVMKHLKEAIEIHRLTFIKNIPTDERFPRLLSISEEQNIDTSHPDLTLSFKLESDFKHGITSSSFTIQISGVERERLFVQLLNSISEIASRWSQKQEEHLFLLTGESVSSSLFIVS